MESLIQQHKDNWQALYDDLFTLREATQTGRKTTESGGAPQIAPFTDLICQIGFGKAETSTLQQQMRSVLGIELHGAGAGL